MVGGESSTVPRAKKKFRNFTDVELLSKERNFKKQRARNRCPIKGCNFYVNSAKERSELRDHGLQKHRIEDFGVPYADQYATDSAIDSLVLKVQRFLQRPWKTQSKKGIVMVDASEGVAAAVLERLRAKHFGSDKLSLSVPIFFDHARYSAVIADTSLLQCLKEEDPHWWQRKTPTALSSIVSEDEAKGPQNIELSFINSRNTEKAGDAPRIRRAWQMRLSFRARSVPTLSESAADTAARVALLERYGKGPQSEAIL